MGRREVQNLHSLRNLLNTKGEAVREYLSQHLITSRWASESNLAAEIHLPGPKLVHLATRAAQGIQKEPKKRALYPT